MLDSLWGEEFTLPDTKKKTEKKQTEISKSEEHKEEHKEEQQESKSQNNTTQSGQASTASAMMQIDFATKKLNAKKIQTQIEREELQRDKLKGNLLPKDQVLLVTETHFNNLTSKFSIALDEMLEYLIMKNVIDRKESIELKKEKHVVLNKAIEKAKEATEQDIIRIGNEQSK